MKEREFTGIYTAAKETKYLKNNTGYIVQISYDMKRDSVWADFKTQNSYSVYDNPDIISVFVKEPKTMKEIKSLLLEQINDGTIEAERENMAKKITNKRMAYIIEYGQENYRRIYFKLHRTIDADLLAHLEKQPNKNAYLKELIRQDMEKGS